MSRETMTALKRIRESRKATDEKLAEAWDRGSISKISNELEERVGIFTRAIPILEKSASGASADIQTALSLLEDLLPATESLVKILKASEKELLKTMNEATVRWVSFADDEDGYDDIINKFEDKISGDSPSIQGYRVVGKTVYLMDGEGEEIKLDAKDSEYVMDILDV
jgi:transcriptional regulator with XRE-family HTH domain